MPTGSEVTFPQPGSRDALCGQIGKTVMATADQASRLLIRFDDESELIIPKADPLAGPEIAHCTPVTDGRTDYRRTVMWENLIPTRRDPP